MTEFSEEFEDDLFHVLSGDGENHWVVISKSEKEKFRALQRYSCNHDDTELRDFTTSNGGIQRKQQCKYCGSSVGQAVKNEKSVTVPNWDYELASNWDEKKYNKIRSFEDFLIERMKEYEFSGYASYEQYLRTPQWKAKKDKVLLRDKYLCQSCLENAAISVHHLTYDRIFAEPFFDLIAICKDCHFRIHEKKIASVAAEKRKNFSIF